MKIIKLFVVLFLFASMCLLEWYFEVEVKRPSQVEEVEEIISDKAVEIEIGNHGSYTAKPREKFGNLDSYVWRIELKEPLSFSLEFVALDPLYGFVSGFMVCNDFTGKYRIQEDRIIFTDIVKNILTCGKAKEDIFLEALKNSSSFVFNDNDNLIIFLKDGNVLSFSKGRETI